MHATFYHHVRYTATGDVQSQTLWVTEHGYDKKTFRNFRRRLRNTSDTFKRLSCYDVLPHYKWASNVKNPDGSFPLLEATQW